MNGLKGRSLLEHSRALQKKEYSSVELTKWFLDRIEKEDGQIGAFLSVDESGALLAAAKSDRRRAEGKSKGILDGIPYSVKDNFCTKSLPTTCASRMLSDFVPPYDAAVVERMRDAGCILLGKNNMDEFAMGSTGEHSYFGTVRNPHHPSYVAGGSSGGSAAAVAADESLFSIGSDTGGSIRQPAAFCGTVGFKPTYGAISRYGLIAMASSLDCVGIATKDVSDCRTVFSALVGRDPRDATSLFYPTECMETLEQTPLPRLRIAVVQELWNADTVSKDVLCAIETAMTLFARMGAKIEQVSLPSPEKALASYCVLSAAEASSNMGRFDGVRLGYREEDSADLFSFYSHNRSQGLGTEVKRRILFGAHMLSEKNRPLYYDAACAARDEIRARMQALFSEYDILLTPTAPTVAFPIGAGLTASQKRRSDLCSVYASLAGLPAISLPLGKNDEGLPLAVQLTAPPLSESLLLQTAELLERFFSSQGEGGAR